MKEPSSLFARPHLAHTVTGARVIHGSGRAGLGWRTKPLLTVFWLVALVAWGPDSRLRAEVDTSQLPPPDARSVDFATDIQPIFDSACLKCHGEEKPKSRFALTSRAGALQGGQVGIDIVVGDSAKSPLIHYVANLVEDMEMPPRGKGTALTSEQIGLLRAWIDQGANWAESPVAPAQAAGSSPRQTATLARVGAAVENPTDPIARAASDQLHWSFRPVAQPPVPSTIRHDWGHNPIDRFILARLEANHLSPSQESAPATLLRRLCFSLTGLPPSPKDLEDFLADSSDLAYAHLVERLLASPRYGERWARHWLDVVRFAESNGFETNTERPNSWPYRDYVIRAFNEDKPYDQFVLEQLAGDALGADEATGFLVGGPYDAVKSPDIHLTSQQRMDELHDMVSTAGSAFLGLTVGCARCHNHKFDPISQTDYYSMQAVFAGVQHGERAQKPADYEERMNRAALERKKIASLQEQLLEFVPLAKPCLSSPEPRRIPQAKINEELFAPAEAKRVRFTIHATVDGAEPCLDEWEIFGADDHTRNIALASNGATATASGTYPNSGLHRLEHIQDGKIGNSHSWISNERGRGWIQIELPATTRIDRMVWGRDREGAYKDRVPSAYSIDVSSGSNIWRTVAERPSLRPPVHPRLNVDRFAAVEARYLRFTIEATTSAEPCLDELEVFSAEDIPRNVALAANGAKASASGTYAGNDQHKLEHVHDGRPGNSRSWISDQPGQGWVQLEFPEPVRINRVVWSRDREGMFNDRLATRYRIETALVPDHWQIVATSSDREPYKPGAELRFVSSSAGLTAVEAERLTRLREQMKQHEARLTKLTSFPMVYAGRFEQPGPSYRLNRGEPLQKREQVPPAAIHGIGPPLTLPFDAPEQQRRLALARWIVDPAHPLTARVVVNRLWHFHFGRGIVSTPSDFGHMGGRPTHPELLDWLASELLRSGWSIKHVQRLMVLSAAFRQSSQANEDGLKTDAGSTLLWRFPPHRLEAEPLRDTILATSGVLDLTMGGRGFDLFEPNGNYVKVYNSKQTFGPPEWRRMIYQSKPRMRLDDTFGAFDCPDAGQVAPRRNVSTTPLQALNLLNSPFMLQQANLLAQRLEHEAGPTLSQQVERAFLLAFNRRPSSPEASAATLLAQDQGLPALCRALFNANEFVYVF